MPTLRSAPLTVLFLVLSFGPAPAQVGPAPETASPPPGVRLGVRVEGLRQATGVRSTLVVAADGAAYLHAIGLWAPKVRFPVLIDDGTPSARDNIARFVRAFGPSSVLRLEPPADAAADDDDARAVPERVGQAVARAWDVDDPAALGQAWAGAGWTPPGLVVASAEDPAWPAAAALAAGRGQRLAWLTPAGGGPNQVWAPDRLTAFDQGIRRALRDAPLAWDGLGDELDALTVCINIPTKTGDPKGPLATTDVLGRHASGERYAYVGVVLGNEQEAAYRAMCALFLPPRSVWLADGYDPSFAPPYRVGPAADLLRPREFGVTADAAATLDLWRRRASSIASGAFEPAFIHVNSAGHPSSFRMQGVLGKTPDVPALDAPAAVHFIHSFSASAPAQPATIAGRWLAGGAYAYVGAVHEPRLGAFFTPEQLLRRMLGGMPMGAAIRQDSAPAWKVNMLGDPLVTMPGRGLAVGDPVEIEGGVDLESVMKAALRDQRLAEGMRLLTMLGRSGDAAELAAAVVKRDGGLIADPEVAREALPGALRSGDGALLGVVFSSLGRDDREDPLNRDALWHAGRLLLSADAPEPLVQALRLSVRNATASDDAGALRPHLGRLYGNEVVKALYLELTTTVENKSELKKLRDALAGMP